VVITAAGRKFRWQFLRAAVAFALIGSDLVAHFDLKVDLRRLRLISCSRKTIPLQEPPRAGVFALYGVRPAPLAAPSLPPSPSSPADQPCSTTLALHCSTTSALHCGTTSPLPAIAAVTPDFQQLVAEFPAVVNKSKVLPRVTHNVEHIIETTGRPVSNKYRRLDPERLAAAKAEFAELEQQGIIRKSSSNWSSPLHMVKKAGGTWRPCGDFRKLNIQTTEDKYTCPNIADLTARLAGCKVFSKLDLRKGYHQVPVKPEHVAKTALLPPWACTSFSGCHLACGMQAKLSNA
jgi:hypothetical protein